MTLHLLLSFALSLIAGAAWSVLSITFLMLPQRIWIGRFRPFNRKPFTCEPCCALWTAAIFCAVAIYVRHGLVIITIAAAAFTAACIASLMNAKLREWIR